MIELLADALIRPRFDARELAKLRDRRIELIKATKDSDPAELIGVYGRAQLFGSHPLGQPTGGSEASLGRDRARARARVLRRSLGADRLILVFRGRPRRCRTRAAGAGGLRQLAHAGAPLARRPSQRARAGVRCCLVDSPDSAQTYFWLANVGVEQAISASRSTRSGEHAVRRPFHVDAEYGAAHQIRLVLQRARWASSAASWPGSLRSVRSPTPRNTRKALDLSLDTLTRPEGRRCDG